VKERGADSYYGYGWVVAKGPNGEKVVTHNGGNGIFFADMAIVPEARLVVFLMTNVVSETRVANMLLEQIEARFLAGRAYPVIPEVVEIPGGEAALKACVGTYPWTGRSAAAAGNAFRVTMDGGALFIEAGGQAAFDALHSVRKAKPGRLERLSRLMDKIVTAYRKGDFGPLAEAYGDVTVERLKASWTEASKEMEERYGRILRHEILGSAATGDRDETVVRFHCERGTFDRTYVWALDRESRLLGASARGLAVRLRLYPSGEREFFTWDGGIRPPKLVRFEPGPDGRLQLHLGRSPKT
jgi:hypothetical protein